MFLIDDIDDQMRQAGSTYNSTIPKFKREKGNRADVDISDPYDYDGFAASWENSGQLWNEEDRSDKYLEFRDKVSIEAEESRNAQLKLNTGLWDRIAEEDATLGGIQRLLSTESAEASYERALASTTYQTLLSAIDNIEGHEDDVAEMLTSDSSINYMLGQADYLDGDVFDWYKRQHGEDFLSGMNAGMAVGLGGKVAKTFETGSKLAMNKFAPKTLAKLAQSTFGKIYKGIKNIPAKVASKFTKSLTQAVTKVATKRGAEFASKLVPFASVAAGLAYEEMRRRKGDNIGAALEAASAICSGVVAGGIGTSWTGVGGLIGVFAKVGAILIDSSLLALDIGRAFF